MLDRFLRQFARLLERWLLLWLVLLCGLAFYWSDWLPGLASPFVESKPILAYLIALTMLAIGSLLPKDEVHQVARRWPTVLSGTAVQYTAMPLLAYLVGRLFGFDGGTFYGIVLVGCVPGAMASNVLTLAARGNVSYSVSLTTSATLFSPLVVPLALKLTLGQEIDNDKLRDIALSLVWTVVLPVICGYLLSRRFDWWRVAAGRVASIIANLAILWIIAMVVGQSRAQLTTFQPSVIVALLAVNLLGYTAGYGAASALRMDEPMRRALTLEVGMQNAGVGTMLALIFFKATPEAAIPTAIYTFGCMLTGTILARIWAERSKVTG